MDHQLHLSQKRSAPHQASSLEQIPTSSRPPRKRRKIENSQEVETQQYPTKEQTKDKKVREADEMEYYTRQSVYLEEGMSQLSQLFLRRMAINNNLSEEEKKEPLLQYLNEICKLMLMNPLEIVVWGLWLDKNGWHESEFDIYTTLLMTAFAVKQYMNEEKEQKVLRDHLHVVKPNLSTAYNSWLFTKKKIFRMNPKELNRKFSFLNQPLMDNHKEVWDYNYHVDEILEMSPPYNIENNKLKDESSISLSGSINKKPKQKKKKRRQEKFKRNAKESSGLEASNSNNSNIHFSFNDSSINVYPPNSQSYLPMLSFLSNEPNRNIQNKNTQLKSAPEINNLTSLSSIHELMAQPDNLINADLDNPNKQGNLMRMGSFVFDFATLQPHQGLDRKNSIESGRLLDLVPLKSTEKIEFPREQSFEFGPSDSLTRKISPMPGSSFTPITSQFQKKKQETDSNLPLPAFYKGKGNINQIIQPLNLSSNSASLNTIPSLAALSNFSGIQMNQNKPKKENPNNLLNQLILGNNSISTGAPTCTDNNRRETSLISNILLAASNPPPVQSKMQLTHEQSLLTSILNINEGSNANSKPQNFHSTTENLNSGGYTMKDMPTSGFNL